MDLGIAGKLALVTGSTAGIGYAIAQGLAAEGVRVIVTGRTKAAVDKAVAEIGGNAIGFAGDLTLAATAAALAAAHPGVEILVNCLGLPVAKNFEEISDDDWLSMYNNNVVGGMRLARHFLPAMQAKNWGRIIFISSESAYQIPADLIHYGASKAAQIAAARGLAEHLAGTGITVNSVLPGATQSRAIGEFIDYFAAKSGETREHVAANILAARAPSSLTKRIAAAEEVAALVTYIASTRSSATTGAALRAEGGTIKSAF